MTYNGSYGFFMFLLSEQLPKRGQHFWYMHIAIYCSLWQSYFLIFLYQTLKLDAQMILCHEKFDCYGFINKRSTAQFLDENTYFFATILCHHSYVQVSKFNFTLYISGMSYVLIVFIGKSRPNVHIACKRNELSNILTTNVIFKKLQTCT